jgi:hypothetical protein
MERHFDRKIETPVVGKALSAMEAATGHARV